MQNRNILHLKLQNILPNSGNVFAVIKLVDAGNVVTAGDVVAKKGEQNGDWIRDWGRFLTT